MSGLMVAIIRLPDGEEPFMRSAIEEAAGEMNAIGDPVIVMLPGDEDLTNEQAAALLTLGLWLPT